MARLIVLLAVSLLGGCSCKNTKVCNAVPAEAPIGLDESREEANSIRKQLADFNDGPAPPSDQLMAYCQNKWLLVLGQYCKVRVDEHCSSICPPADVAQCKGDGRHGFVSTCAKRSLPAFKTALPRCNAAQVGADDNLTGL